MVDATFHCRSSERLTEIEDGPYCPYGDFSASLERHRLRFSSQRQ